jgi:hypothetical protein
MAELRIPIVGEFKGQKAFKQANTATSTLQKGVKRLGAQLAATFGATQLLKFAKNAAKAFIEDEKAATRLAQSVKNLGLAFETPRIEQFIEKMAAASGVTDDQLRPAMQKLLQTTGSLTKSTELMNQALDISRGSGVDYETVVNDLSMAYVGQTRGLRKYSLGVTQAELKTMSFAEVQERLTKNFSGANAAYLETYAGKMGILSNAAGEAQEIIGKGLMEALTTLSGDGNTIQPLADSMLELATYISDVTTGLADMIAAFKELPGLSGGGLGGGNKYIDALKGAVGRLGPLGAVKNLFDYAANESKKKKGGMGGYPSSALGPGYIDPNDAARKKAEAAAAKRAKDLANAQKKTLDTQKKANALTKASKVLDLDRISITAALRNQISETDRLSLNLQLALLDKNDSAALKLSAELSEAVKRQNDLNAALRNTPEAPNPYRNWVAPTFTPVVPTFNVPSGGIAPKMASDYLGLGAIAGAGSENIVNVVVNLDGDAVGGAITNTQVNQSLSGTFSDVSRYNGRGAPSIK